MAQDALIETARYRVSLAEGAGDLARSLALRAAVFRHGAADEDGFDARCRHVLVEDRASGALVCSYRLLDIADGRAITTSYSAQFYALDALAGYPGALIEVGRFCIAPVAQDSDVLRLAWAALTRIVDSEGVGMLFGCASFEGTAPDPYLDALALLRDHHIAPARWRPRVKAAEVFRFAARLRRTPDAKRALKAMPPLLRSYLMMGGWVSDHAVVDRELGTLHVFTGLEVAAVPPARARALRDLAGAERVTTPR
jgi:L-ornithine Nalpha-acyltransferase